MFARVLFPINAEAFTYLVPEEITSKITIGSFVTASFRKQKKTGIVTGLDKAHILDGARKIKTIETVLDEDISISENFLKLLHWVGQYYLSTTGLALKNAVPSGIFEGKRGGKSRITYDDITEQQTPFLLNAEQQAALSEINNDSSGTFLLYGVTGSGKTEVYLRAIEALNNREAIVLVPEIALTAQMIDRFRMRFQDKVAFYHSGLSSGEKLQQWRKIQQGHVKVVLGVRSAVFAPFKNLGLIIIDEEHETSYKQFEGLRYSARDVALARAKIEGIKIVLGSATPSIESFFNAQKGKIKILELTQRIEQKPLPRVNIIDMTKEDKKTWSLSSQFLDALKENLLKGHQSLLMLNRRGYSPFLICSDCGYTYKCPSCSITLTYHKDTHTLNCHYCNSYIKPKNFCPRCNGTRTKNIGVGTQRVEEELHALLPELSLKRMDRDTTRKKLSHYRMVKDMEGKKIDVLVGTQMVAKGHDFPHVAISGVVLADVALNLPDFRSAERTFQLFTQLAGRAGRGEVPGKVYIQTYEPYHYVFSYVQNHDYRGFYDREVELRKGLSYPPFSRLIRIIFSFMKKDLIEKTVNDIVTKIKKAKIHDVEVLGPAPAPVEKIRSHWRWHVILKGKKAKNLRHNALLIADAVKDIKGLKIDIDVDPINLL
jgi:primosomal protein N' (replication factor Y)